MKETTIGRLFTWVLLAGIVISLIAFFPSFNQIFRSDQYFIANFSFTKPLNLPTILQSFSFDKVFGEPRHQPLSYFLLFIVHKIFKTNFFLYHSCAYLIHILNGFLIFLFLNKFLKDKILAALAGIYFIIMFLHADTVIWTHFIYITLQLTLFLASILLFYTYIAKKKLYLISFSLSLLLLSSLLYETNFIGSLILMPLFFWLEMTDYFKENTTHFPTYSKFLIIFYVIFSFIIMHPAFTIALNLSLVPSRFIAGINITFLIIKNSLITTFSPPPEYYFGDISYIALKKVSFFSHLIFLSFIAYFFISLCRYLKKKKGLIIVFCYLIGFSYIFTIAFSRRNLYTATQPRYVYFFDAVMLIILGCIIKDIFLLIEKRKFISRFLKGTGLAFYSFLIILNAHQTYNFSKEVNYILEPMQKGFYEIKEFLKSSDYDGYSKIFIEEYPHPNGWHLFLGRGIYLETLFYDRDIFTRNIRDAKYVYNPENKISFNPLYKKQNSHDRNFTLEFDLTICPGERTVKILNNRDCLLHIIVDRGLFLVFGGEWKNAEERKNFNFKVPLLIKNPTRIIIQKQMDTFYILQDGKIIFRENIGNLTLDFKDKDLFLGTTPYFPPQQCYLENFTAWIGENKYDLTTVSSRRMTTPVLRLESHRDYYIKSFKNLVGNSILKLR